MSCLAGTRGTSGSLVWRHQRHLVCWSQQAAARGGAVFSVASFLVGVQYSASHHRQRASGAYMSGPTSVLFRAFMCVLVGWGGRQCVQLASTSDHPYNIPCDHHDSAPRRWSARRMNSRLDKLRCARSPTTRLLGNTPA